MSDREEVGDVDVGEEDVDVGEEQVDVGNDGGEEAGADGGEEAGEEDGEEGGEEGGERWGYGDDAEGGDDNGDDAADGDYEEGEGQEAEGEGEYAEGEEGAEGEGEGEYAEGEGGGEAEGGGEGESVDEEIEQMSVEELQKEIAKVKRQIVKLENDLENEDDSDAYEIETFSIPPHCVPIRCDVRFFDWEALAKEVQFDVIVMDPPWQLAGAAPTRGVALGYKQLHNKDIAGMPIPKLQKNGFLFIWVINARYAYALELMEMWGYRLVDDITWVKATVNRRLAKGHGFYLQHAKETCLVGLKGEDPPNLVGNSLPDVIFSERRGQSQKPEEIYSHIETLVPNGKYLEIFARRNNLRNHWVSVGMEL